MQAQGVQPKLRTFHPLLAALQVKGDLEMCFDVFGELTGRYSLQPAEREYLIMLRATQAHNDGRFYSLLHAFREDVLVPSPEAWVVLRQWFLQSVPEEGYKDCISLVDDEGLVAATGDRLRSIDLDDDTRSALLAQVEHFAAGNSNGSEGSEGDGEEGVIIQGGGKGKRKRKRAEGDETRARQWGDFKSWLLSPTPTGPVGYSGSFDVVVDGANVGYYKQNYAGAPDHVDYRQIDWLLLQLTSLGYTPLLVLHCRHLRQGAYPASYNDVISGWRTRRMLLETPQGCNDDWFWLYTAVALKCKIVTNDEMRDHHFQMLAPRWFCRWKERNQIHFGFGEWFSSDSGGSGSGMCRRAVLSIPKVYSSRSQQLHGGAAHYFPSTTGDDWLCICKGQA